MRKASRAIAKIYDRSLEPSGLKSSQFTLLAAIAAFGSTTVTALATEMVLDRTTLTRNLKPLVRDGCLTLVPGSDRRTRNIEITAKGLDLLDRAIPLWQQAQDYMTQSLGPTHWGGLWRSLDHVIEVPRNGIFSHDPQT